MHRENYDHFIGRMTGPPLEDAASDQRIFIEAGVFVPNDPPGTYLVHNMAHYEGILLSVHFKADAWSTVEGSAVMVAPGIAFAAAHVLLPRLDHVIAGELRAYCVGLTSSGMRLWRVRHVTKLDSSDVVILSLEYASPMPSDGCFKQAVMTTRLPKIGERVMIAGFRASNENLPSVDFPFFPVEGNHIKYGVNVHIGVGEVTQHFLGGRGTMPPGPAIEVACATSGGLSGGPVFDENGMLVGILSSSLDHPDGGGPSYVSLVVPALPVTTTASFLKPNAGSVRLLDLPPELCHIDGRDALRDTIDPVTGNGCLEITSW